jgi:hypothetical protein
MSVYNSTGTPSTRVPTGFEFRVPWYAEDFGSRLHEELRCECSKGHILFRVAARAVARRRDCDDVFFELS